MINRCALYQKPFLYTIELSLSSLVCFFSFSPLIWWIRLTFFLMLNHPGFLRINPTWSWCFFKYRSDKFNWSLICDFHIYVYKWDSSKIFFSCEFFYQFWTQDYTSLMRSFYLLHSYILENLYKRGIVYPLKVCCNHLVLELLHGRTPLNTILIFKKCLLTYTSVLLLFLPIWSSRLPFMSHGPVLGPMATPTVIHTKEVTI